MAAVPARPRTTIAGLRPAEQGARPAPLRLAAQPARRARAHRLAGRGARPAGHDAPGGRGAREPRRAEGDRLTPPRTTRAPRRGTAYRQCAMTARAERVGPGHPRGYPVRTPETGDDTDARQTWRGGTDVDEMDEIVHEFLVESYENLDQLDQDLVALERPVVARAAEQHLPHGAHDQGHERLPRVRQPRARVPRGRVAPVGAARRRAGDGPADGGRAARARRHLARHPREGRVRRRGRPRRRPDGRAHRGRPGRHGGTGAGRRDRCLDPRRARRRPEHTPVPDPDGTAAPDVAPAPVAAPPAVEPAAATAVGPAPAPEPAPEPEPHTRNAADGSIRVDVDLLDTLMRQVGELVLVRNQIDRIAGAGEDQETKRSAQRLSLIASELQEGVMKTRMQPIEHVWSRCRASCATSRRRWAATSGSR